MNGEWRRLSGVPAPAGDDGLSLYFEAVVRLRRAAERGAITPADYRRRLEAIHAWLAERNVHVTPDPALIWRPDGGSTP